MTYVSLGRADRYHRVAAEARLSWRSMEHTDLERFSEAVFTLTRLAKHQDDDTGWREVLYPARRARNIATTVPLPFSHRSLGIAPLLDQLEQSLPVLRVYGGDEASELGEKVLTAGRALVELDDTPLLETILEVASSGQAKWNRRVATDCRARSRCRRALGAQPPRHRGLGLSRDVLAWSPRVASSLSGRSIGMAGISMCSPPRGRPRSWCSTWAWFRERQPARDIARGLSGYGRNSSYARASHAILL